jgi:hypothetical protein
MCLLASSGQLQLQRWQQAAAQLGETSSNVLIHRVVGNVHLKQYNIQQSVV